MDDHIELSEKDKKLRSKLVVLAFSLFTVFIIGMIYLATNPATTVTAGLAYAAGLSMITLPCTFPLVFVIVPMSMGKGYRKGFFMALLFGLGLTFTITVYAVVIAVAGSYLGMDRATTIMYVVAGISAFIFGLSALKLIKFSAPSMGRAVPSFIVERQDYIKALFMGLFLGNAGVACPNPAFYVLLTYIATVGDLGNAAVLGAIHGVGRATPLIFLAILAILGVNATQALIKKRVTIDKVSGWFMLVIGAVILTIGLYGHQWLLTTGLHGGWNKIFSNVSGAAEYECCIEPPCKICMKDKMWPGGACFCRKVVQYGSYKGVSQVCGQCAVGLSQGKGVLDQAKRTTMYALPTIGGLIIIPIGWYYIKKRKKGKPTDDDEA